MDVAKRLSGVVGEVHLAAFVLRLRFSVKSRFIPSDRSGFPLV